VQSGARGLARLDLADHRLDLARAAAPAHRSEAHQRVLVELDADVAIHLGAAQVVVDRHALQGRHPRQRGGEAA